MEGQKRGGTGKGKLVDGHKRGVTGKGIEWKDIVVAIRIIHLMT